MRGTGRWYVYVAVRVRCVYAAGCVRCVYVACTLRVRCVYVACTSRVRRVYVACTSRVRRVYAACTPRVCRVYAACTPRLRRVYASAVRRVVRFKQCMHQKMTHIAAVDYDEFVGVVCSARNAFYLTPGGLVQFNELLQSIRRMKTCKLELWQHIVSALSSSMYDTPP